MISLFKIWLVACCTAFVQSAQDCSASSFNCNTNDPCDPLCEAGVISYPGNGNKKYVECTGPGQSCESKQCPPESSIYDLDSRRCEPVNDNTHIRCALKRHDCSEENRNPCSPDRCNIFRGFYLGEKKDEWITCTDTYQCITNTCDNGERFNPIPVNGTCVPNSQLPGCTNTFTHYNYSQITASGVLQQLSPYNTTKAECETKCLENDRCFAYMYWNTETMPPFLATFPKCNLVIGYGQEVKPSFLGLNIDTYTRDGCQPDPEKWYTS